MVFAASKLDLQSPNGLTEEDLQKLPPGWQPMAKKYFDAVKALHGKVVHLFYRRGTLQAQAVSSESFIPEDDKVFEWLSRGMTMNSAAVCMVSGQYGHRRHYYKTWPCLADEFDLQFANEIHDKEGYDGFQESEKPQATQ